MKYETVPESNKIPMYFDKLTTNLFRKSPLLMIQPGTPCDRMWKWAREHCKGEVDVTFPDHNGKIEWLFEHESDVTMFILKWR